MSSEFGHIPHVSEFGHPPAPTPTPVWHRHRHRHWHR
eukprot:CAMPEP_0119367714 /NCGR_PEP_ID=MMETSP1334-20130426/14472_1 /TAXON_ID=127549 /ORGANISM="Calcidiscus leptoporus, Strain RCC1130" /LENGTH=36 /DNA_ID= /DNA_START= /DNA_END= /DNA_ORIENTATION=